MLCNDTRTRFFWELFYDALDAVKPAGPEQLFVPLYYTSMIILETVKAVKQSSREIHSDII